MKGWMAAKLGVAIAGVLLAGSALAQGPGGGMGPGPGFGEHRPPMERAFGPQGDHGRWWNNPKVVERLKLSDAQRKSMDEILLQHREKLIDLRGNLEKAELTMEPLMRDEQPNEAQVLAQIDKVAQARAELEKANARFLLAIRGKLTPDQWKQLQTDRDHHNWSRDGQGRGQEGRGWNRDGQGREGWKQGQGGQGQGGQFHHQQAPPPPPPPAAAPQGAGPQSKMDDGAGPDGADLPAPGAEQ